MELELRNRTTEEGEVQQIHPNIRVSNDRTVRMQVGEMMDL